MRESESIEGLRLFMKKKILATLMLSSVVLSNVNGVAVIGANDVDSQIAAKNQQINELTAQQAAAQQQVDDIQGKVDAIVAEQAKLTEENTRLEAESRTLAADIERLSADIVSRDDALKKQARSAQIDGSASSYINTILDSKSIVDAVSRVNAMREIVSANNRMLEQQKADKEAIIVKQKANQEAITTLAANRQKLADDAQTLQVRQAELEATKLNLAAEKATAEGEKNALLEKKAIAEEAARQAAARQAEYQAQQAALAQQQAVSVVAPVASAPAAAMLAQTIATSAQTVSAPTSSASTGVSRSAAVSNARYDASSYPVGECTWGVKSQLSWVGPFWGDAQNWAASARAEGFRVDTTPAVGAIAVWSGANGYGGGYGHVAVVTAVESSTNIQVTESNYMGNRYVGNFRGWFNPVADGVTWYIHAR